MQKAKFYLYLGYWTTVKALKNLNITRWKYIIAAILFLKEQAAKHLFLSWINCLVTWNKYAGWDSAQTSQAA